MNYNELTKETKLFLNKAIDIYSIIHDKKIIKNVPHPTMMRLKCSIMQEYEFTKLDKKVLSLFIA